MCTFRGIDGAASGAGRTDKRLEEEDATRDTRRSPHDQTFHSITSSSLLPLGMDIKYKSFHNSKRKYIFKLREDGMPFVSTREQWQGLRIPEQSLQFQMPLSVLRHNGGPRVWRWKHLNRKQFGNA